MTTLDNPQPVINETEVPFLPTAIRLGLIGSLIFIVYSLIANLTGLSVPTSIAVSLLNLIIALGVTIGFVIYVIRYHRDKELGGYISFGRAFLLAFAALVISTIISNIFNWVYLSFIDTSHLESVLEATEKMMSDMGAPADAIEKQMSTMREQFTPMGMMVQGLKYGLIGGAVIALICAAIMKKKPDITV